MVVTGKSNCRVSPVEFFLKGEPSTPPAIGVFEPGSRQVVDLVFGSVPTTNTPPPTFATAGPATPVPPTATPAPVVAETPEDEEEEGGGICSSTSGLPFEQSAANMLVLFRAGGDVGWREVHPRATEEGPRLSEAARPCDS